MRKLQAFGLLTLGLVIGIGAMTIWNNSAVQAQESQFAREMNARFEIGKTETDAFSRNLYRFLHDKKSGDCYLATYDSPAGKTMTHLIKTDDESCRFK